MLISRIVSRPVDGADSTLPGDTPVQLVAYFIRGAFLHRIRTARQHHEE